MENFKYIGWIPCVNGHLDFGLMRVGISGGFTSNSKDKNIIEENFSCAKFGDSHNRRIVLQSYVDWRDSFEHPVDSGKFRVLVTAEVNKSDSMDERYLEGNLLIYPLSAEPNELELRKVMPVHQLCHGIKNTGNIAEKHVFYNKLEKIISNKEPINELSHFHCSLNFRVEPNGITKIGYNSANNDLDEESKYLISRQAFYYLKYSIHTHKHHTAKQDSLTTITSVENNTPAELNKAGLRIICQLKRELTSLKRTQNTDKKEHPTNNSVGIIAYIKSLICSLSDSGIITSDTHKREIERFAYIKDSFNAQMNKIENEFTNLELVKSKSKVWLGFLIVSMWGLLNFTFKSDAHNHIEMSNMMVASTAFLIFIISALLYFSIKRYYLLGTSPEASEHLYTTKWPMLVIKIILPIILVVSILKLGL